MRIEILSFSMTGNTAKVCDAVADHMNARHRSIHIPQGGGKLWQILRLGFSTLMRRSIEVDVPDVDFSATDVLVLGAPVWAWRVAVPMRSFLKTGPNLPNKLALVLTSGSESYPEKVFAEFGKLAGKSPIATLHVSEAQAKADNFAEIVARFCAQIATESPD